MILKKRTTLPLALAASVALALPASASQVETPRL